MVDVSRLDGLEVRKFGRLGWPVKVIGLGGAWLRKDRSKPLEECAELVVEAVARGVDFIDTSIRYGDSELIIGLAWPRIPAAQRPRLATKSQVIKEGDVADGVYQSCLNSLSRLGVDKVDLFQLHESELYGWDRIMGPRGAAEGLRRCRDEGLCEGIGVTGRPPDLLAKLVDTGEFDSVLTYYEYDLITSAACAELMPAAERHNVAVIAGSVARMGLFGYQNEERWAKQPAECQARRAPIEALFGKPIYELADESMRYLLADPRVTTIVVGSSRLESLLSSVAAAHEGPLPADVVAEVRRIHGVGPPA